MEFQLKEDDTLTDSIRRIVNEQIEYALNLLKDVDYDRDEAVHETRKVLKKVRAMLRLIRDVIGETRYKQENTYYRDIARTLAPLRDDFVLIETLDMVQEKANSNINEEMVDAVGKVLEDQYQQTRDEILSSDVIPQAIESLEIGCQRIADWAFVDHDYATFEGGLRRTYRRGKKRMNKAYQEAQSPELFHDWRKRVKYLWHQVEVLSPLWPALLPPFGEQLHELSNILGDAHDLAELHKVALNLSVGDVEKKAELLVAITTQRQQLESLAHPLGCLIYAETVDAFVERFGVYWETYEQAETSLTLYMKDSEPI